MKTKITSALIVATILGQTAIGHADSTTIYQTTTVYSSNRSGYGGGYGGGYGHGGGYNRGVNDGAATVLLGVSASLLSLSALDSASRHRHMAPIQNAHNEALNYRENAPTSAQFLQATSAVRELTHTEVQKKLHRDLTDAEAAKVIVELNQEYNEDNYK